MADKLHLRKINTIRKALTVQRMQTLPVKQREDTNDDFALVYNSLKNKVLHKAG